ncbi:hypothetical protein Fcan01_17568 [Folsomia candida]|uniref:F-box domain-containing protein n=1 Tax=Folsomia candida TaxID=158441 RepID=A0A226DR31_FOLCA|nr:hypothetical protein Fcan01_17568 [Folsomia candida]
MEQVFNNELILERILTYIPVTQLKQCSLINSTWNTEATKCLNKISTISLSFNFRDNHDKIRSYLRLVRQGGRIHSHISASLQFNSSMGEGDSETMSLLLDAFQTFGSNVRHLDICIKIGCGNPLEYSQLFSLMPNLIHLSITLSSGSEIYGRCRYPPKIDMDAYFPQNWKLFSLAHFKFRYFAPISSQDYLSNEVIPSIIRNVVRSAANLIRLEDGLHQGMKFMLEGTENMGGLEKIQEIVTKPPIRDISFLLNIPFLSRINVHLENENAKSVGEILQTYKNALFQVTVRISVGNNFPKDGTPSKLIFPSMKNLSVLRNSFRKFRNGRQQAGLNRCADDATRSIAPRLTHPTIATPRMMPPPSNRNRSIAPLQIPLLFDLRKSPVHRLPPAFFRPFTPARGYLPPTPTPVDPLPPVKISRPNHLPPVIFLST